MPPTLKTLGLTVRYANYKDYDRMLSVLTPTEGRIDAIARGCRRPKSRLSAAAQPFAMGEFAFNVRGQRYALGQFELQESYYPLREDLTRLSYASYVTAMAAEAIQPRQQAVDEFALTLHALAFLAYSQMPPQDVAIIYTIQLMAMLGYRIETGRCVACGRPVQEGETVGFDPRAGGVLCAACAVRAPQALAVDRGTLKMMEYIETIDPARMNVLRLSRRAREQLGAILRGFAAHRMDGARRLGRFIEKIEQVEDSLQTFMNNERNTPQGG